MPVWLGCMTLRRARGSICVAAACLPIGSRLILPMVAAICSGLPDGGAEQAAWPPANFTKRSAM